jgi:hypothetical protein
MNPTASAARTRLRGMPSWACAVPAVLSACAISVAGAHAETLATVAPQLRPDQLDSRGQLSFAMRFAETRGGVPAPVRRSVLRFPAGFALDVPQLSSCSAASLQAQGPGRCPPPSELGSGYAVVEAPVGSQTATETVSLWLFLGPPRNLQPTVEILAQGYTPFDERTVLVGTMLPAGAPYGEALVLTIPPIPTLPLEPYASIVSLSLAIGAHAPRRDGDSTSVRLPSSCPRGGFPFAAEFAYADGSSSNSFATVPCPR